MRLLLKNVRLETGYLYEQSFVTATKTELFDVLIENGIFVEIAPSIEVNDAVVVDANMQLLIPSFKEMHTHIDKTYFSGEWKAPTIATEGIFSRFKEEALLLPKQLDVAEDRAHAMVQHYIKNGHTHIRTHVNVDPQIETKHIDIVKRVLDSYQDQITYEIVAFPQHGLLRNGPSFLTIMEKALQMGATHIGGVDPALVDRNSSEVIKTTFQLAEKYGVGIDIHLHEQNTLGEFDIQLILNEMEQRSFKKDVTISHAFALADLPEKSLNPLITRMAANQVGLTTTIPIGAGPITIPVKYLYDKGVKVAFGHDSLVDHWSPFGSGDTIQKLNQFIERFGYIDEWHIGQSLKYATGGITPLNLTGEQQWPKTGDTANALLVDAVSSAHLIARRCPISTVLSKGKVIHKEEIELKGEFR
ncbi:amidohydrolase [Lysinibacillus odysseyi]|uniref:Deaminase n=1 Tax=Lysinibacillus odysseyi 34hs-1 = NBRC 100172 TaxID=1220589 RepID=A0A0A3IB38_9BACI|nr:amidohydrolase [Lysinibacillus odysseyi]KGR81976.1 deaminase [Lysinibacillus odysseyi 34hs-1 = NBRC 100172]